MNIRPLALMVLCSAILCHAQENNTRSIAITTNHHETFTLPTWQPLDLKKGSKALENFEEIIAQGGNVIIDFYADWCNPCKVMMRTFDSVAKDSSMPDLIILKINVDDDSLNVITKRFSFQSIPALFYFKNGKQVHRSGSMSVSEFKTLIKKLYA